MLLLVKSRASRLIVALVTMLATCGCSSERLAGWYVTRKLDDYLDLSGAQEERARARVDAALAELRKDTLPGWIALLREGRERMSTPATDAQLARLQDRYDALLDRAVAELIPHVAPVLAELDDTQIDHFSGRLRTLLDKTYEDQLVRGEARRAKQDELIVKGIEDVIGRLSGAQKETILSVVHALPDDREAQYRADRQTIEALRAFLRGHPDVPTVARELSRMWADRYAQLGPSRSREVRLAEQRKLMLAISGVMTDAQRKRGAASITEQIVRAKRFLLAPEAKTGQ
jgi:hypothetical protein